MLLSYILCRGRCIFENINSLKCVRTGLIGTTQFLLRAVNTLFNLSPITTNMFHQDEMPKEELTRLKRAFALFDVDGDGSISTKVTV